VAKIPRITSGQMPCALTRDGWTELRTSGSHIILHHPTKRGRPVVPHHAGILAPKTYRSIVNEAGLTDEELRELL
jgi:predicted RNA binding protein YcfA (HicA-like mRNA interferase family)